MGRACVFLCVYVCAFIAIICGVRWILFFTFICDFKQKNLKEGPNLCVDWVC